MFEQDNISQILDLLGNKNRRRIIDLLHNKPCFVTEISNKLSINPKAVIEHLAMLQKEDVIGSYCDDKRRKYYYLLHEIKLSIEMDSQNKNIPQDTKESSPDLPLADTITHLHRLIHTRKELRDKLDDIERDIDRKMEELVEKSNTIFKDDTEPEILLALIHSPLTPINLSDACGRPIPEIIAALYSLSKKGYIKNIDGKYTLSEIPCE